MFGAQFQLTHLTLHLFTYFSAPCNTRLQLWSHLLVVCLKEPRSLPGCIPYLGAYPTTGCPTKMRVPYRVPYQGAFPTWVHFLPGCIPYHWVHALPGCIPYQGAFPTTGCIPFHRVHFLPGCIPYQGAFHLGAFPTRVRSLPGCIPYQGAFPTRVQPMLFCIEVPRPPPSIEFPDKGGN